VKIQSARKSNGLLFKRSADGGDEALATSMNVLLADVFTFYVRVHGAHWNVVGPDFAEYHKLFLDIYEDVYDSIDPIAENVRKLGSNPPSQLINIIALRSLQDRQEPIAFDCQTLAEELAQLNLLLIKRLKDTFDMANGVNEQGVANFLAERIDKHQFWNWQLSSSLGFPAGV
jgi:starvation-inducible DNA-binding protein